MAEIICFQTALYRSHSRCHTLVDTVVPLCSVQLSAARLPVGAAYCWHGRSSPRTAINYCLYGRAGTQPHHTHWEEQIPALLLAMQISWETLKKKSKKKKAGKLEAGRITSSQNHCKMLSLRSMPTLTVPEL